MSTNTHTPDTIVQTFHSLLPQTSTHNAFLLQVVIGGINVDFIAKGKEKGLRVNFEKWDYEFHEHRSSESDGCNGLSSQFGQTNRGSVCQSFGGVGRNIAGMFCHIVDEWFACFCLRFESYRLILAASAPSIQDSLSRLGCRPLLISATGADSHSDAVFNYCKHMVSRHQSWGSLKKQFHVDMFIDFFLLFFL